MKPAKCTLFILWYLRIFYCLVFPKLLENYFKKTQNKTKKRTKPKLEKFKVWKATIVNAL